MHEANVSPFGIARDTDDPLDLAFAAWGAAPVYLSAGESHAASDDRASAATGRAQTTAISHGASASAPAGGRLLIVPSGHLC